MQETKNKDNVFLYNMECDTWLKVPPILQNVLYLFTGCKKVTNKVLTQHNHPFDIQHYRQPFHIVDQTRPLIQ